MEILKKCTLRNFENNMIQHLHEFSPKHSESLGQEGLRKVIKLGVKQAELYGFSNYGPVQFYIELMFMFGSYFDSDCQFYWALEILTDPEIVDQTERADILYEKVMDYIDKIAGPEWRYARDSLSWVSKQNFKDLVENRDDLETDILARFKINFPQKCRYLGDRVLLQLVKFAVESAEKFSVPSDTGVIVFAHFMFILGCGFTVDPLYPWCESTLSDESITDPVMRIKQLHSEGITCFTKVLAE
ncbi:MAG: hypothetical protein GY799_27385 [Desulfobulbaceae bacterium]|nr:hypothetical protein [Desulfobulbaceae bacterium]